MSIQYKCNDLKNIYLEKIGKTKSTLKNTFEIMEE